jgi:hypothetical protein
VLDVPAGTVLVGADTFGRAVAEAEANPAGELPDAVSATVVNV